MFNFLRKSKAHSNKNKRGIITKMQDATSKIRLAGNYKVATYLTQLASLIDNPATDLDSDQINFINNELDSISKHTNATYEDYLLNKIDGIKNCITNRTMNRESELVEKTTEKIVDVKLRIDSYDKQLESIDKKMDEAVGVNESLWRILNSDKKSIQQKRMVDLQLFNSLLASKENASIAKTISDVDKDTKFIEDTDIAIDDTQIDTIVRHFGETSKQVESTSDKISKSLFGNLGGTSISDEYTKACEAKALIQKADTKTGNSTGNSGQN